MAASVSTVEFLTDSHYSHANVARVAARRGDHLNALEHLAMAEATALALGHHFSVRLGGRTKGERWCNAAEHCSEQIRLCQAFIQACLQGYVSTIHEVDGIQCTDGEYVKDEGNATSEPD